MGTSSFFGSDQLELGPCDIYWDTVSGGENIYLGGVNQVVVRYGVEKTDLNYAQYGAGAADRVVTSDMCEIEVGLAQSNVERMEQTIQGFRVKRDGGGLITGFSFGSAIGERDSDIVKQVTLVLIRDGGQSSATFDTVEIWRAAPSASVELTYDAATQRFTGLMFTAYKDFDQPDSEGKATYWGVGTFA